MNGIQWVPADATQVLPAGATPATPVSYPIPTFLDHYRENLQTPTNHSDQEFAAQWGGRLGSPLYDREVEKAQRDWCVFFTFLFIRLF